jgi:hypothetical protein
MTGMSNYYLSFTANDTAAYFELAASGNELPASVGIYSLGSCSAEPLAFATYFEDSLGVKSLNIETHNLVASQEYKVVITQNEDETAGNVTLFGNDPVYVVNPSCNVALNGSFENVEQGAQLGDLNQEISQARRWRGPTNESLSRPDYFHANSTDSDYQTPSNFMGNIAPVNNGNGTDAYAGLFTLWTSEGQFREWMAAPIETPMFPGSRYYVEYYVSLASNSLHDDESIPPGILFTDESSGQRTIDMTSTQIVGLEADIQPTNVVTTSGTWHKVEGVYTATGDENTITVANFLNNNESVAPAQQNTFNRSYFFVDEISITPMDLCCTTPQLVIEDGWDVADLINSNDFAPYISGNTLSVPSVVYLEGEFTVNSNFTIDNTIVKVNDATGKINITSGNTLEVTDSEIEACGLMWEGIYVNGTNAEVVVDNSTIADALKGVNSINGGVFTVTNSIFDANDYGIYVDFYNGNHQGSVEGTTFKSSYLLKDLLLSSRAKAGIYLNEVINTSGTNSITIGSIYAENQFIGPTPGSTSGPFTVLNPGIQYGIIIDKSTANIYNNKFESFIKNVIIDNQSKAGVKVIGVPNPSYFTGNYAPTVVIGSFSSSQKNEFIRSTSAVLAEDIANIQIIGNDITFPNNQNPNEQVDYAISISENRWPALIIDVVNNDIRDVINGVLVSNCLEQDRVQIDDNYFSLANTEGNTAIYASSNGLNSSNYSIEENDIQRATNGIIVNGGHHPRIIDNDVEINNTYYSPTVPHFGISTYNISSNIDGNAQIKNNIVNTPSIITNTMVHGIAVASTSIEPEITCNDIQRTGSALHFSNVINYSPTNTFPIYGNVMQYNHNAFVLANSAELGYIGSSSKPSDNEWRFNNNYDTYTDGADGNQTTLFTRGGGVPYEPLSNVGTPFPININTAASGDQHDCGGGVVIGPGLMIQDSLPEFEKQYSSDTTAWIAKYQYYRALPEDSLISKRKVQSFKDSMDLSPLGALLQMKSSNHSFSRKASQLTALSCNNIQESRLKTVIDYQLQANNLNWDTLPHTVLSSLENIAYECPFEAGPAVYEARSLLMKYTGKTYFNPCEGYTSTVKPSKRKKFIDDEDSDKADESISIYPNPVKDKLNIHIQLEEDEVAHWSILTINGQLIQSGSLNNDINKIDLSDLSQGVYFIQLKVNNQLKKADKLIIQ